MLRNRFPHRILKEQRRLLILWVHESIDKHAPVEIPLRRVAQDFILAHHALVHVGDQVELCVGRVFVLVDFVAHG